MRKSTELVILAVLSLFFSSYRAFGQDNKDADHGSVEFGVRTATGDVYGRPDLPFQPSLKASQFNEYQDVRDGFYVRRLDVKFDNVLHTKNYFALQSQSALYHDQGYLASYGQYGKFKVRSVTTKSRTSTATRRARCLLRLLRVFTAFRR